MVKRASAVLGVLAMALTACDTGSTSDLDQGDEAAAGSNGSAGTNAAIGGSGNAAGSSSTAGTAAGGTAVAGGGDCQRPAGMPAVTLTYDDSLASQIATAAPALAAHQLKATFFVQDVRGFPGDWAALKAAGHELGSHTFKHPCPKVNTWVAAGDANEDYDLARMTTELDESIALLKELGQVAPFTFAYPCGIDWVGEAHDSYVPLVMERFSAARGVAPGVVKAGADLSNVPATFSTGEATQLIAIADGAKASGGWVVFGFHGVGGDHTPVSAEAHEALLAYLDEQRSEFYVATFGELAACMGQ